MGFTAVMKLKTATLIPLILAVLILAGGPFSHGSLCLSDEPEGLLCYCCFGPGMSCTMISCSGCCGAHGSALQDRWSPEMLPEAFHLGALLKFVYCGNPLFPLPEIPYLEIQDKPPNRA